VSSAEKAAQMLTQMDPKEFRILLGIELGMSEHEFVPVEVISKYSGFDSNEVKFWIGELDKKGLLWRQIENYVGYILNYTGYDVLALNALVKNGILEALGKSIGVGKEADVHEGLNQQNQKVAIKFHRLGRTSFRNTRRKREFVGDRKHISWLYQSRLAAEREFIALKKMALIGDFVPNPLFYNRHSIVMEYIEGQLFSEIIDIEEPDKFLKVIINCIKNAYNQGIIHGDLSEFNIMVNLDEKIKIIDWPQYLTLTHPNAKESLERDVNNILVYFKRKYDVGMNLQDAINLISSK